MRDHYSGSAGFIFMHLAVLSVITFAFVFLFAYKALFGNFQMSFFLFLCPLSPFPFSFRRAGSWPHCI
jgi:hypothetical protein